MYSKTLAYEKTKRTLHRKQEIKRIGNIIINSTEFDACERTDEVYLTFLTNKCKDYSLPKQFNFLFKQLKNDLEKYSLLGMSLLKYHRVRYCITRKTILTKLLKKIFQILNNIDSEKNLSQKINNLPRRQQLSQFLYDNGLVYAAEDALG